MQWVYKNNTQYPIEYKNSRWPPNSEAPFYEAIPDSVGLTCIQRGSVPDPVLCHEDIILQPNEDFSVDIKSPVNSPNVALSIVCISLDGGAECRFNSPDSAPVPIDTRDFIHVMSWVSCSRIYLTNTTQEQAHISISAIEVVS